MFRDCGESSALQAGPIFPSWVLVLILLFFGISFVLLLTASAGFFFYEMKEGCKLFTELRETALFPSSKEDVKARTSLGLGFRMPGGVFAFAVGI